ncbi:PREDICTED: nuclear pore complex protein Nup93-like [Nicrophorus vespilloides]|uniref:Nuclear pore protein n=1 Tax=Nicrophorus vespilloides TaxID=110193 RepID=A0ABM1N137_NICVS|nr:PREDICTED: nuclear pore complex protein Nup93-like [Nicrophorus vespilloides]
MASDFSDLLFEAEKLTHDIEGPTELPKVDRSLRQVLEASNELYTRVAHTGSKDIQANLLLGSKGIDLPRISQKLDLISSQRTIETIDPIDDVDLDSCLENEIRNCIMGIIDEEKRLCYKSIMEQTWEHESGEWKQEKRKILNAMTGPSGNFIDPLKKESMFMESPIVGSMHMTYQEAVYAAKIIELNKRSLRGDPKIDLVSYFAKAAEEFKDTKVNDMWEIIKFMTEIQPICSTEDAISARKSKLVIMDLVHHAKKYLETRYKTYMSNVINENLMIAQRGGIPGTYPLVKSYLGIRLQGGYVGLVDGDVEDRPLWPMVYYCLRSGDISAALECLEKSSSTQRFPELVAILRAKYSNPKHPDIQKLEEAVRYQYRRLVRNETDPFKRIVWAVLGCCDIVDEHSEVARTADDWLWLKLCLVRVDYAKEDHIDYFDFQRTIIEEYGESHYDAMHQPHLYFQVLALTGQFEAAIEFLSRIERYKVHAVHMAIALNELYILAGPSDYSSPLIFMDPSDPKPARRLNIVRLILVYVRKFEIHCIEEAVNYFYLLHNIMNGDNQNMYVVCVGDLAQETREYERIFGKIQRNGIRTKGALDEFKHNEITVEKIAMDVAKQLVIKGSFEEAVELYDIACNQTEVLTLLNTLLSQVVTLPASEGSMRNRLFSKVREIYDRYSNGGFSCSANLANAFCNLKDLFIFFEHYHSKNYSHALKCLSDIKLIPMQASELDERVNSFKCVNVDVCKIMPDILLATMNIYFSQYQKIKDNEYVPNRFSDFSIEKQLVVIREQAKVLTNFTGMLPYRMPGDTNSRLVQMEILMH